MPSLAPPDAQRPEEASHEEASEPLTAMEAGVSLMSLPSGPEKLPNSECGGSVAGGEDDLVSNHNNMSVTTIETGSEDVASPRGGGPQPRREAPQSWKNTGNSTITAVTNGTASTAEVANASVQLEKASSAANQRKSERAVKRARICFLLSLTTAAVALGLAAYLLLGKTEQELATEQFGAVAKRALFSTQANTLRKRMGSMGLANTVGSANPDEDAYPQVYLLGFERMARDIIEARNGRHMTFAPLIYNVTTAADLQAFEAFAYDYFRERFPLSNAGVQAVEGPGIWTMETPDGQQHKVTDSKTRWGGRYKVVAPKLQHDEGNDPLLMTDFYKIREYGESIDKMIDCADARRQQGNLNMECGVVSEMFFPDDGIPISRIFAPVYPSQDPFYLGGFVASTIVWYKVLEGVFDESIRGVDCVVKTATGRATYHIHDGMAEFV